MLEPYAVWRHKARAKTPLDRRIQYEWGEGLERKWADRPIQEAPHHECEVRFVECQFCEGAGEVQTGTATIYEPGCGFWHDDAVMARCPECEGTGRAETTVYPVECDEPEFSPITTEQKAA